jgi:prepilin-type N-terminal cleavage/methylation domain-containing protein
MLHRRQGFTLFELLLTLTVLSVLLSLAFPRMQRGMDGLAVRSARENAFALLARTRVLALHEGGAELEVDATNDRITIRSGNGVLAAEQSYQEHNVDLILDGVAQQVVLRYDSYGLGRMASRTLRFRTGSAEAKLTISSFGRARR